MAFTFKPDHWYDIEEITKTTGIGKDTLAYWRKTGEGPEFAKIGKRVYYNGTTLATFFNERMRKSTSSDGGSATLAS